MGGMGENRNTNRTGNAGMNVTLRRVLATVVAEEKH
jgi:hypothetical protein